MNSIRKQVEAIIERVQEEGRWRMERASMKTYSFKSQGHTIKVEAEGLLEAHAIAKEKNFGFSLQFLGAQTEEGEAWCESCESDRCACPDPDGCHGDGGFSRDEFEPVHGHYQIFKKCDKCATEDF